MTRDQIIREVAQRINFCIVDANTFLWAKSQQEFPTFEGLIGGGNFYVLLATFSALDFLSQMNGYVNSNNEDFYSEEEVLQISEELRNARNIRRAGFMQPRAGDIKKRGKDLFVALFSDTSDICGLDENHINLLWRTRNRITHEFDPVHIPAAAPPPGNYNFNRLVQVFKNSPIITQDIHGRDSIDVHSLNLKLERIGQYIINKIEICSTEQIERLSYILTRN